MTDFFEDFMAAGIGVGAGVYAFKKMSSQATNVPVGRHSKGLLMNRLRDIRADQRLSENIVASRLSSKTKFLDTLKDRLAGTELTDDIIRSEWSRAVQSTVPNENLFNQGFVSSDDIISDIRLNLRSNKSLYMSDVFNKFYYNMEALMRTKAQYNFVEAGAGLNSFSLMQSQVARPSRAFQPLIEAMGGPAGLRFERLGEGPGKGMWTVSSNAGGSLQKLFTIPEAFSATPGGRRGLVQTGSSLQNLYAPGLFQQVDASGNLVGEMMNFGEYKIHRLATLAAKYKSGDIQGDMMTGLATASKEIDKLMPFVSPSVEGALSPEAIYRANQFTAVDLEGNLLTGKAKRDFILRHSESLGFVPTGGESRFAFGTGESIFGGFASEIDYARKPWQRLRQYTPSQAAQEAIQRSIYSGPEFGFLDAPIVTSNLTGGKPAAARLKTLYLDQEQLAKLGEMGFPVGDGELLINKEMSAQLEATRLRRIRVTELTTELSNSLMNAAGPSSSRRLATPIDLQVNQMLGRGVEGSFETISQPSKIIGASMASFKGPGGEVRSGMDLFIEETIGMTGSSKVFGSLKGQARQVNFGALTSKLSQLTKLPESELAGVGAIARAADIGKDPSRLLMQQFTGVMEYARQGVALDKEFIAAGGRNAPSGFNVGLAQEILGSADEYISRINTLPGGAAAKTAAIREIAEDVGLTPEQMSAVFGTSGTRVGIAGLVLGDPKELTGAGKIGTFEPRLLNLLEGGAFGQYGDQLATDLMARLYHGRPETVAMHTELRKTMESIEGSYKPGPGSNVFSIADLSGPEAERLRARGGFLSTGLAEIPYIHMPGYENNPAMRPRVVGGGTVVSGSPVADIFKDIERDLRNEKLSSADLLQNFTADTTGYTTRLYKEFALGGKGQGAIARGELLGSRFLTATSDIGAVRSNFERQVESLVEKGYSKDRIIGVPMNYASQMLDEMESLYGAENVSAMRKRIEAGEAIGGVIARHPYIGPYSAQPVMMVPVQTDEPTMLVPENYRNVTIQTKSGKKVAPITEGVLPGLALDKDADIPMAIALNKEMEATVRQQLASSSSSLSRDLNAYKMHSIRSQLLSMNKSSSATMTAAENAAAAVGKLGITSEEVGRVSTALTKARAAIVNSTMGQEDITRGLSLLEWMEQQPISGKHLDPKQVLEGIFEKQMFSIRHGAGGDPNILSSVVNEMLSHPGDKVQNEINQALLGKGLNVEGVGFVKGFELERTAGQIGTAMENFMAKGIGEQESLIQEFLSPSASRTMKRSHLSRALMATDLDAGTGIRSFASGAQTMINNQYHKIAQRVRPFAKPTMIGLAAAGTAALLMSDTPQPLNPSGYGSVNTAPPVKNTNQSRDEIQGPAAQQLGNPTSVPPISNRGISLDETGASNHRAIQARINARNLTPQQRAALAQRLGANYNGSLQMNIRDSRRTLNNTTIADMLDQ